MEEEKRKTGGGWGFVVIVLMVERLGAELSKLVTTANSFEPDANYMQTTRGAREHEEGQRVPRFQGPGDDNGWNGRWSNG